MARVSTVGKVRNFRLPLDVDLALSQHMEATKVSQSNVLRAALAEYLMPKPDKPERIPTSKKVRQLAPLSQHTKARMQVLRQFDKKCSGWTTSELANATGQHTPNVSKRVQELAAEFYIESSGEFRKSLDSGKNLTIWRRTTKQYTGGKS